MRSAMRDTFEKSVEFLLRVIWERQGHIEARRDGFHFEFSDGPRFDDGGRSPKMRITRMLETRKLYQKILQIAVLLQRQTNIIKGFWIS